MENPNLTMTYIISPNEFNVNRFSKLSVKLKYYDFYLEELQFP